jgi:hypothetical protein
MGVGMMEEGEGAVCVEAGEANDPKRRLMTTIMGLTRKVTMLYIQISFGESPPETITTQ